MPDGCNLEWRVVFEKFRIGTDIRVTAMPWGQIERK